MRTPICEILLILLLVPPTDHCLAAGETEKVPNLKALAIYAPRPQYPYEAKTISYGTETKVFGEPKLPDGTLARLGRNEGVRRMQTAERAAVVGSPDLESLTTSHIERAFLTVRQELKRFQRKGLGYSKDLETHKRAVALHFGVYNFVRQHHSLGTTPAVAAGLEEKPWSLEQVVEMTAKYVASNGVNKELTKVV